MKKEEIEAKPAYVKSVQLDSTLLLFSARLFLAEQSNFPLFSVIEVLWKNNIYELTRRDSDKTHGKIISKNRGSGTLDLLDW